MNPTFLYVAAVYAASVALGRRWNRALDWRVAGLFYLLVLGFLFRPMTADYVDFPADFINSLSPWSWTGSTLADSNSEMNDLTLQIVPWAHQVRESWRNLEVPLWNAANGAGYPLLGNGQSSAFSPLRMLGLPLSLGQSITFEAAMKLLAALTFAFLYMRRRAFSVAASVITAISFAFCSFLTVWLHFPIVTVSAFLPAIFLGVDLLVERRSFPRLLFLVVAFTMLLVGGHPESAAHIVFGSGIYLLYLLLTDRTRASLLGAGTVAAAGLIALLIASPVVAPLLETLPLSHRMDKLRAMPWDQTMRDARFVVPSFQPGFFGNVRDKSVWGPGIAETVGGYAGTLAICAWIYLLLRFLQTRHWRDLSTYYLFATPLLLGVALNVPGLTHFFHRLPLFSMAANGRLQLLVCWGLAVLTGIAVDHWYARRDRTLFVALGVTAIVLALPYLLITFPGAREWNHAVTTGVPGVLALVAAAAGTLIVPHRPLVAVAMIAAAIVVDLFSFGLHRNSDVGGDYVYPTTPMIEAMQQRHRTPAPDDPKPFRIAGPESMFFPNSSAIFGLEDIRSHDPMANGRYLGALRVFTGYSSSEYFGMMKHFDHPFLDYLNVRYVMASPLDTLPEGKFVEIYSGQDGKIYQNREALPRFFAPRNVITEFDDAKRVAMILKNRDWADTVILKRLPSRMMKLIQHDLLDPRPPNAPLSTVRVTEAGSRRFTLDVNAPRWTLVISSQPFWPGWKAYRGDERLEMLEVNAAFIGILVPPGRSNIEVVYKPLSFYSSAVVSLLTMLALLASGILLRRRERAEGRRPAADVAA